MNAQCLRRSRAVLVSALSALTLSACAGDNLPSPLRVDLDALRTCERILTRPPLPDIRPTDDARVAFKKDDAALLNAGDQIDAGRGCVADVRASYAAKAKQ